MQKKIISEGKNAVFVQDHAKLKNLYNTVENLDYNINMAEIFLKLFYYACNHNRKETIIFLFRFFYDHFSISEQIGLRQSFYYGKYKIKNKEIAKWYGSTILPIIKVQ